MYILYICIYVCISVYVYQMIMIHSIFLQSVDKGCNATENKISKSLGKSTNVPYVEEK